MSLSVSLSFEQKVAYAERSLGVDLQKDSRQLFDLVQSMLEKPLPEPWRPCFDEHWRLFFYNDRTKVSAWSHPMRPAHQRVVDAYRRVEVAPSSAAVKVELQRFRASAEAEWQQWRESQAEGRTFYFHVETRQTTWEDPSELIMGQLALEVEMLNLAFDLPRTPSEPEGSQPIAEVVEVSEETCEQSHPSTASAASAQSWLPSQLPSPRRTRLSAASLGAMEHLQEALVIAEPAIANMDQEAVDLALRQQASAIVAAARRWLCQQRLATRSAEAAAVRLQALVRGWLCRRFVAAERQRQEAANRTVKSFLQRWLSRKALLDALVSQEDAPAVEVDDDSIYSSDYEAGSSPSRSRAQSPTGGSGASGASSRDPFILALKGDSPIKAEMTTSDHVTQGPSSPFLERHASRWEGVSSPHWRANLELPDLCEPPVLQAPAHDFQMQAETFVTGLGRHSKGFEHLLEVARAELPQLPALPNEPRRDASRRPSASLPPTVPRVRRKLRRVAEQDFQRQVHKDVAQVSVATVATSSHDTQTEPMDSMVEQPQSGGPTPSQLEPEPPRWERRVLELLAEESPKRAEALPLKRGNDIGSGYALRELAKSADKAKELKKTLQKDHREVYEAYSNVFDQLKVVERVKLPRYPNIRPKVKSQRRSSRVLRRAEGVLRLPHGSAVSRQ